MRSRPLIFLLALVAGAGADAAEPQTGRSHTPRSSEDASYWTARRLADARPLPLPAARGIAFGAAPGNEDSRGAATPRAIDWRPAAPRGRALPDFERLLFKPRQHRSRADPPVSASGDGWGAAARGSAGLDFTSSRLVPADARAVWPYSAVGKLFLSIRGERFTCSGSVVSARVVLTAGHCAFTTGVGFHSNLLFIPAYHEGNAPFGEWAVDFVVTTDEWREGSDEVPNEADFAFLVMRDRQGQKIGDATGWLGFATGGLAPNHVTMLGYPGNLDGGERMQQSTSGAAATIPGSSAVLYGSPMGGGSSGGPWVQNFGDKARGQRGSRNSKMNRVVGVTSFGPSGNRVQILGSSNPGRSADGIFREACNQAPGNCRKRGRPQG